MRTQEALYTEGRWGALGRLSQHMTRKGSVVPMIDMRHRELPESLGQNA